MTTEPDEARPDAGVPDPDPEAETAPDPYDDDFAGEPAVATGGVFTVDDAGDVDFASEHDLTAVDPSIIQGTDKDREPESPRGWSGMER